MCKKTSSWHAFVSGVVRGSENYTSLILTAEMPPLFKSAIVDLKVK